MADSPDPKPPSPKAEVAKVVPRTEPVRPPHRSSSRVSPLTALCALLSRWRCSENLACRSRRCHSGGSTRARSPR